MDTDQLLDRARLLAGSVEWCVVSTHDGHGGINSRVVQPLRLDEGLEVAFMTHAGTRKAAELRANSALTMSFLHSETRSYVSLGGRAVCSNDLAAKNALWQESLRLWFPNGPEDNDVIVVVCKPDWVELWSYAEGVAPVPLGLSSVRLERNSAGWCSRGTWPES